MRPTYLEVNLSQLKQNLENIRTHVAPAKVLVVLKANAYGHGVDGVAPFIAPFADYIGVAIVEEAIHLRKMGIATPILVMGGTLREQLPDYFEYDLTLAASSLDLLTAAEQMAESTRKRIKTHLKIDTGMERIGVREYEAEALIEKSLSCSHLSVEGIFTHFANSESHVIASRSLAKQSPTLRRLLRSAKCMRNKSAFAMTLFPPPFNSNAFRKCSPFTKSGANRTPPFVTRQIREQLYCCQKVIMTWFGLVFCFMVCILHAILNERLKSNLRSHGNQRLCIARSPCLGVRSATGRCGMLRRSRELSPSHADMPTGISVA